jgi:regulator of replication initiation timing
MNTLAAQHINHFRTAQELSSTHPSQLRRTIAELEARIEEQDAIIALQNDGIQNLASKLADREGQILILENLRSKPDQGLYDIPDDLRYRAEKENLERANRNMEALIEDFEDGFWTLFAEQRQGLEECLKALEQLPATPETKSLYARVKRGWQAVESAKKRNMITPVNALRQMADLERGVVTYILGRPKLTLTTAETYRAWVLLEAFVTDRQLKQLTTSDSLRIISAKEEKKIYREQALRAMRRAAWLFSDRVKFEKKGKAARLIEIGEAGSKMNCVCRCIITVCYMICYCNSLLQSFDDLPMGREMMEFVLGGIN